RCARHRLERHGQPAIDIHERADKLHRRQVLMPGDFDRGPRDLAGVADVLIGRLRYKLSNGWYCMRFWLVIAGLLAARSAQAQLTHSAAEDSTLAGIKTVSITTNGGADTAMASLARR